MNRLTHGRFRPALILFVLLVALAGCAGSKRSDAHGLLSAEQRYALGRRLIEQGKFAAAIRDLGQVDYFETQNRQELEPLVRLAIADATFYQGGDLALIDARALYLDFVTLFGDHPQAPYAQFQAGICSLAQVNNPSKDQSETNQAIRDLLEVSQRFPGTRFARAADIMIVKAQDNLAEHEYLVGRFYLKKKAWIAASRRFSLVLEQYPGFTDQEKILYHLGLSFLGAENEPEASLYFDKVVEDFPNGRYADDARKALGKLSPGVEGALTSERTSP